MPKTLRNSPSGEPFTSEGGDPSLFLNQQGDMVVPGGSGTVTQVDGVNGISTTNPTGPVVTVDGSVNQAAAAAAQSTADGAAAVAATALQTTSNDGAGAALAKALSGTDAPFKTLTAGSNVTIDDSDPDVIQISATGGGGAGVTQVDGVNGISTTNPTGPTVTVDGSVNQAAAAAAQSTADDAVSDAAAAQSTADGAAAVAATALQTTSNDGAGAALAKALSGTDAPFKTLTAGSNVTIDDSDPDVIQISASGGGVGTVTQVDGINGISTTNPTGPTVTVDGSVNQAAAAAAQSTADDAVSDAAAAQSTADGAAAVAATALQTTSNDGAGAGLAKAISGTDAPFKTLTAGANVTIDDSDPDVIQISATGGGGGSNGQENMPIVLANLPAPALFFGSPAPAGVFRSLGMISTQSMTVERIGVYFLQAGSGTFNLGLYDDTGTLLAGSTDGFKVPIVGINSFTIPPTAIVGVRLYYVGMTSRLNGTQMRGIDNALTGGPTPHAYTEELNGNNIGNIMRPNFNINGGSIDEALWCIMATA